MNNNRRRNFRTRPQKNNFRRRPGSMNSNNSNGLNNNGVLIIKDESFNDANFMQDLLSSLPNKSEHKQYSSIVATEHNEKVNIAHYSDIIFNELRSENSTRDNVINVLQKK